MTNLKYLQSMSVDELAKWLDQYGQFDNAPWTLWFDGKYCSNCEPIMCSYEDSTRKFPCAWCELNEGCKFLPDAKETPNNLDTIKMWLEVEVE